MGLYLQGLTVGLAYIAPIGMQNLFVINTALTKPRRRALLTALIVIVFDVILSLACFFGIGALMQRYEWLKLGVLAVGGLVVIRIGVGLVWPQRRDEGGDSESTKAAGREEHSWLKTIGTACAVTWFNPQALIDGTLLLGAFAATLGAAESAPFIGGVETASVTWFIGLTLLISAFSSRFSPKVLLWLNRICGTVILLYGCKLLVDFALAIA